MHQLQHLPAAAMKRKFWGLATSVAIQQIPVLQRVARAWVDPSIVSQSFHDCINGTNSRSSLIPEMARSPQTLRTMTLSRGRRPLQKIIICSVIVLACLPAIVAFSTPPLPFILSCREAQQARPLALRMSTATVARRLPVNVDESNFQMPQLVSAEDSVEASALREANARIVARGATGITKNASLHKYFFRDASWRLIFLSVTLGKVHHDLARVVAMKKL